MSIRHRWGAALGFALVVMAAPAAVAAHAELIGSDPADGAVIAEPPAEVALTFDSDVEQDGSTFTVTDAAGAVVGAGEVDLDVAQRNVLRGEIDAGEDGTYEVRWTAVSIDGHTEEGTLHFTVGSEPAPNTALPRTVPTWPLGAALLAAAIGVAVRRRWAFLLLVLAVPLAGCISDNRPASCAAEHVTIEITLSMTKLTPDDPGVCRDQEVALEIASQVDGVLNIHGYDEAVPATVVHAGDTITLAFTASRSGQFPIELHPIDDPTGIPLGIFTVYEP